MITAKVVYTALAVPTGAKLYVAIVESQTASNVNQVCLIACLLWSERRPGSVGDMQQANRDLGQTEIRREPP
jgi:hypothetical protein